MKLLGYNETIVNNSGTQRLIVNQMKNVLNAAKSIILVYGKVCYLNVQTVVRTTLATKKVVKCTKVF